MKNSWLGYLYNQLQKVLKVMFFTSILSIQKSFLLFFFCQKCSIFFFFFMKREREISSRKSHEYCMNSGYLGKIGGICPHRLPQVLMYQSLTVHMCWLGRKVHQTNAPLSSLFAVICKFVSLKIIWCFISLKRQFFFQQEKFSRTEIVSTIFGYFLHSPAFHFRPFSHLFFPFFWLYFN